MSYESMSAIKIAEFDKRHGGNPVFYGNWFWYENGANRDGDPLGLLAEPSDDDYTRLSAVVNYHQGRLRIAVEKFDNLKESAMLMASGDKRVIDELKALQKVVTLRNSAVEQAKKALAETPTARQRAGARQSEAERKSAQTSFRNEVRAITV